MNYFPEQVFLGLQEVPNEISLIIPIAGCGHSCKGCHSPEYQNPNNGVELTEELYIDLLDLYADKATCICFFGGECVIDRYLELARFGNYKTALYSGYDKLWELPYSLMSNRLDYLKIGHYNEKLGGLASKITNQRMYSIKTTGEMEDITSEFWR